MRSMKDFSRSAAMPPASAIIHPVINSAPAPNRNGRDSSPPAQLGTSAERLWITWITWAACADTAGDALSPRFAPPREFNAPQGCRSRDPGPGDLGRRLHVDEADDGGVSAAA